MRKPVGTLAVMFLIWGLLPTHVASPQDQSQRLSVNLGGGIKMDFVLIEPGTFMMGSVKGFPGERPVHQVTITKRYCMGVYEVTQAQWKAVMGDNPSCYKGDDLPVDSVSWDHCQEFLAKLRTKLGARLTCRLPTEAEWEYACRAGSRMEFCFGDNEAVLGGYAWYEENSQENSQEFSHRKTHPVGKKKPNAWGLYDMHGNVWEWCQDWMGGGSATPATDPQGPQTGIARVLRGGDIWTDPKRCRSGFTYWNVPNLRDDFTYGFRVALSLAQ